MKQRQYSSDKTGKFFASLMNMRNQGKFLLYNLEQFTYQNPAHNIREIQSELNECIELIHYNINYMDNRAFACIFSH